MKRFILLFWVASLGLWPTVRVLAQAEETVFRPNELASIYLQMAETDKQFLLAEENNQSDEYLPASFRFVNSLIDQTLDLPVGLRLRGNTSRWHPKKSFKIDFREFDGPKFQGNKKFNLKAENNDPSLQREYLALWMYRTIGVPAARAHYVRLYINDEYMGLYLNVEQIDDDFLERHFPSDAGNLYKCGYGANLSSTNDPYNEDLFELETNKSANDRSQLQAFIQTLNNSSDATFASDIAAKLNVEGALRYFALEALIGHWDGYAYNQNNFYLYENPSSGQVEILPYDLDNTFGIDWLGQDWAQRHIVNWAATNQPRPLITRLLAQPQFRTIYRSELLRAQQLAFAVALVQPQLDALRALLGSAVQTDTYYPRTYGYAYADFLAASSFPAPNQNRQFGHVALGIVPYLQQRSATASEQIAKTLHLADAPAGTLRVWPSPDTQQLHLSTDVTDYRALQNIRVVELATGRIHRPLLPVAVQAQSLQFAHPLPPGVYSLQLGMQQAKFVLLR